MAGNGRNVVARAWVQIVPEMSGSQETIAKGLSEAAAPAGEQAGRKAGEGYGNGLLAKLRGLGSKVSAALGSALAPVKARFTSAAQQAANAFNTQVVARLSALGSSVSAKVTSGLAPIKAKFTSAGITSGSGFLSAVGSKLATLGSAVASKASSALSSVKSLFSSKGGESGSSMGEGIAKGFGAKTAAIFAVAQNVANKVLSTITASISSAVSRVDTLNNFPTVLQNLGYSAEDAAQSTNTLSERLSSLPTKLNDAASGVQQLAPASASVQQATDRYLAFNDALLAGAASEDIQSNAMQQLTKSLSTGKMEMDSWMSIQQAMPGQLNQVAKAMLGQNASASDLYNAMKDGSISVQQFADAMVDLDQNGADGIASFAEQAESAVGGISTSFSNMKNAVTKGVANVIQAVGASNIVGVINQVKGGINAAFVGVVSMVGPAKEALSGFGQSLAEIDGQTSVFSTALSALQALFGSLAEAASALISGALETLPGYLSTLASAATPLIQMVSAAVPVIVQMVADVASFAASLLATVAPAIISVAETITAALPLIQALWDTVWPAMSATLQVVFGVISSVVQTFMAAIQVVISAVMAAINGDWEGAWNIVSNALSSAWEGMKSAAKGGIDAVYSVVTGIKDKVTGFFSDAGEWLVNSGKAMLDGLKQGIQKGISGAIDAVKSGLSQIRSFFPFSPAKRGPFSGHGYTTYSGQALMTGLGEGISRAARTAVLAASSAMGDVSSALLADELGASWQRPGLAFAGAGLAANASLLAAAGQVANTYAGDTYNVNLSATDDARLMEAIDLIVSRVRRSAAMA